MVMKVIIVIMMMMGIVMKIMNSSSYLRILPIITQNGSTSSPTRSNSQLFCLQALQWCGYMFRSSHPEVLCKKSILRNFTKFTGKHQCKSLFFNSMFEKLQYCKTNRFYLNRSYSEIKSICSNEQALYQPQHMSISHMLYINHNMSIVNTIS